MSNRVVVNGVVLTNMNQDEYHGVSPSHVRFVIVREGKKAPNATRDKFLLARCDTYKEVDLFDLLETLLRGPVFSSLEDAVHAALTLKPNNLRL